jgi:hypothetical protein
MTTHQRSPSSSRCARSGVRAARYSRFEEITLKIGSPKLKSSRRTGHCVAVIEVALETLHDRRIALDLLRGRHAVCR